MQYEVKSSFDRSFKKLSSQERTAVKDVIKELLKVLERKAQQPTQGLGLKRISREYWEVRVNIQLRILFAVSHLVTFYFVGDHDAIRRFIRE